MNEKLKSISKCPHTTTMHEIDHIIIGVVELERCLICGKVVKNER